MENYDVIVVGGGFAGVRAARDLGEAGLSVAILEARNRLGGRTWTAEFGTTGRLVEFGGAWIAPRYQPNVATEIARYGLELAESHCGEVKFSWSFPGREARTFPVEGNEVYDLERALFEIITASRRIQIDVPRDQQGLTDLDVSVTEFLDRLDVGAQTRQFLEAWAALGSGALPTEWSALTALSWIAAMENSAWAWFAAVAEKFADGTGAVINRMVEDSGATVALSAPVRRVEQDTDGVTLTTRSDELFRAAHVVVASPISTWNDVEWSPVLSPTKAAASGYPHLGRMRKYWIQVTGAPEDVIGFGLGGGLLWVSPEYDLGDSQLMVAFSTPQNDLQSVDIQSIEAAVCHVFRDGRVISFETHDWATDPFSKGTWMCNRPGQLTRDTTALQQSEGRLVFANADLATRWIGWIDGALETGARAAREILARWR